MLTRGTGNKSEMDNTEQLINKICTNFANQLNNKIDKRLDKFEALLDSQLKEVNNSIQNLTKSVSVNTNAIKSLENKCDFLEQHLKRNNLRFIGIPEKDDEVLVDVISNIINDTLMIPCSPSDIDCTYRVGKSSPNVSRTIFVQFLSNIKRNQIYSARKLLKGTNVSLYEDLTATRYYLLSLAKKKHGKNSAWSSGGKIFVWCARENKSRLINSEADL